MEISDNDFSVADYDYLYCNIYDKLLTSRHLINRLSEKDKELPHLYEIAQMKEKAVPRW